MSIRDAKPGDVLADRDGAIWLRGTEKARVLYDPSCDSSGDDDTRGADALPISHVEQFGPFTVLYPPADAGERDALRADVARLQSELDAARAIIESGAPASARDDLVGLAGKVSG